MMKRGDDESFEDYKLRCKMTNKVIKFYLRGRLFWDSNNGTYIRGYAK